MRVISVIDYPESMERAIAYFQSIWASEYSMMVYDDSIRHALNPESVLPRWYLLLDGEDIVGCAGLITNDFISRMDMFPWICALYIDETYRGHHYGNLLLTRAQMDAKHAGFDAVYLCTDHQGYYEQYDYEYIGLGYHP